MFAGVNRILKLPPLRSTGIAQAEAAPAKAGRIMAYRIALRQNALVSMSGHQHDSKKIMLPNNGEIG
jgi:hypothetical protein